MGNVKPDYETKFLLGLIAIGLLAVFLVELFELRFKPITLTIFLAIPIAALIFKLLGGLDGSSFKTPLFKLGGTAAFLLAFIAIVNPIVQRQTIPEREEMFSPTIENWMAIDNSTFKPIDTLKVKFMDYKFTKIDFGKLRNDASLYFDFDTNYLNVFKDANRTTQLGRIPTKNLNEKIFTKSNLDILNTAVYLNPIELHHSTKEKVWFPYRIKPISFDDETTTYEISDTNGSFKVRAEITGRNAKLHNIDHKLFLITIHGINHSTSPFWARFSVIELKPSSSGEIK